MGDRQDAVYLDLELPSDLSKLSDAETFLTANAGHLICIDEVQRAPGLFPLLRSLMDRAGTPGQFLLLGSASPSLLRQSSESLAGRVAYLELSPFLAPETGASHADLLRLWTRGGFPRSFLAPDERESYEWRQAFVRTYTERDLLQFAAGMSPVSADRLLRMCAHLHGQNLNSSKLASSLGVSDKTVRAHIDLLAGAYLVRLLPAFDANMKKRLVKAPRLYVRDSGILHALLAVGSFNDLAGHPCYGASWEGLVLDTVAPLLRADTTLSFYRTSDGTEIDFVISQGDRRFGLECKASSAPSASTRLRNAASDIGSVQTWIVAPVEGSWPVAENISVTGLRELLRNPAFATLLTCAPDAHAARPAVS